MTDEHDDNEPEEEQWAALEMLRQRAAASRQARDESIHELRRNLSDEEILDTFGIDLSRLDEA